MDAENVDKLDGVLIARFVEVRFEDVEWMIKDLENQIIIIKHNSDAVGGSAGLVV